MKRVRMTMKAKRVRMIHIRFVKPNVFWLRRETFSSYSCVSVGEPLARGGEMCAEGRSSKLSEVKAVVEAN